MYVLYVPCRCRGERRGEEGGFTRFTTMCDFGLWIRRRSGCASPTARSSKRRSRRTTRYVPSTRSCAIPCVRTSSLSNSSYVRRYMSKSHPSILFGGGRGSRRIPPRNLTASNPPLHELKVSDPAVRDLTLAQLGLAPSSVLHLRFVDDALNRASLSSSFFFLRSLLALYKTPLLAFPI